MQGTRRLAWRFHRERSSAGPDRGLTRLLALLAVVALVVAACGGGGEDTTETAETVVDGEVTDEEIELLVWGSREYYIPPDQFQSFMEEYPNITINWDVQSEDDILQQLLRMQDAGQKMPDIIHDDMFMIEAFVASGLLRPIDDVLELWEEEDPEFYNKILPITWEETTFDGERYGMSIGANYDIIYYNVPWFEEAGIDPDFETMDEVLEALQAMKETRPEGVPLTVQALAGEGVTTLINVLSVVGAPFDGAVPDLTSEEGQYALDWFIRAEQDDLLPAEAISWGESESRGAFIRGDAGLIVDGITTAGDFNEVGDFDYGEEWATTPLPTESGQGQSGQNITASRTWAITSDVEHPYEASLVLRYIAETDNQIEPLANGSVPGRNIEMLEDPRFEEFLPFFTEDLKETYLEAGSFPAGLNGGEVEEVLEQMFGEIVTGQAGSAQELAEKYQPQLDAL